MKAIPDLKNVFPTPDAIPAAARLPGPVEQREYLCDGAIRAWEGPRQEVLSPLCLAEGNKLEKPRIGSYPLLTERESLQALDAATRAYAAGRGRWPTLGVEERIRHVQEFVYQMKQTRAEVVRLLMWEIGKSQPDSEKEFDRTVDYIEDTIDALKDLDRTSSRFVIQDGVAAQIRRAPLGVVLCMGPFNYPLNETFTTLIPALIMGNTALIKPPKLGVLLYRPLLDCFQKAFPPGVVNTVYGEGRRIVEPLMTSGRVDVLAFIGSSGVADLLRQQHPKPHRLKCVLGLDAKNAAIVLPDADLELAVKECLLGSTSFNGQRCTALKILFVHRQVVDAFLERFSAALEGLKCGMPWDPGVQITPLPEPDKAQQMTALVADATAVGARVINPRGGASHQTLFFPALLYPVRPGMRLYAEEQFGPVIPVCPFDQIEEPIRALVESNYGQQVSLFGTNPDVIADLIDPLVNQVCRVNINSQCQRGPDTFPFTGRKDSAEGTLSVSDALRVFTIRTLVAAKVSDPNKALISAIVRDRQSKFLNTDFIL